jgi:hypothetical protein
VNLIYEQASENNTPQTDEVVFVTGAKIFKAYPTQTSAPKYIVDDKGLIYPSKIAFTLRKATQQELDTIFDTTEREYIIEKTKDVRVEVWNDMASVSYIVIPSFKDQSLTHYLTVNNSAVDGVSDEWKKAVDSILAFNCIKDPSIILINKATLPIGITMSYQPHTVLITDSSAGKSTYYQLIGETLDKDTKNTFLGSIKWAGDATPGFFKDQHYAVALEQLESQAIENLLGQTLTFLEQGTATVSGAGLYKRVEGAFPLIITANPSVKADNHLPVFSEVISYMGRNSYAIGRRFGIIGYGEYDKIQDDKGYDAIKHTELVMIYRALEERALSTLKLFWNNPKVTEYCSNPVYDEELLKKVKAIEKAEAKSFLINHVENSYPHIRGGAVNCAIVDNLPLFALDTILNTSNIASLIDKILKDADAYVEKLVEINKRSIDYALS